MKRIITAIRWGLCALCLTSGAASADHLPSHAQTTFTAYVSEQAIVQTPTRATFDTTAVSPSAVVSASVREMALDAPSAMRICVKAIRLPVTPASVKRSAEAADPLCWKSKSWRNARGNSDTLTAESYTEVATALSDVGGFSTSSLMFYLPKSAKKQTQEKQSQQVTWKVEYLGL